ncbi:hypothetical protein EBB79_05580 [Parasedimentitalea marina]|uniref:Uncharacterized protein n=1 Tax=Parasedimentitalea marina TaxID=2483033 RepID=A0A3T0N056_9RHOB|nr:hypothetical protein [Parasedimentitalea marina]AZV77413.1 hypothetical protein EBB79_05580 [Parasedimentitalea marina]
MIFFSFFTASIFSLTAFLQSEAAWWKGPLSALALFALGLAIGVGLQEEALKNTILPPVIGLATAAWTCAILIGLGSVTALALRDFWAPGRIAGTAFVGGWILISGLQFVFG